MHGNRKLTKKANRHFNPFFLSGDTLKANVPLFLDLRSSTSKEKNITIALPKHAVPDSHKIYLSAAADPLGPSMNNLKTLLTFPQGKLLLLIIFQHDVQC